MEVYPGSTCTLSDSGIHHCKEGILIKVSTSCPRWDSAPGGVLLNSHGGVGLSWFGADFNASSLVSEGLSGECSLGVDLLK